MISEEPSPVTSSNPEDSVPNSVNENSNHRILHDHPDSQIIGDVHYGILTCIRVNSNFCMFVNIVLMIEPKNFC